MGAQGSSGHCLKLPSFCWGSTKSRVNPRGWQTLAAILPPPTALARAGIQGITGVPGESAPGWCQGGVWTRSGLSGTDPIPGSCLISPLSIWALRVLGGDSECFRFLAGCTGRLRIPREFSAGNGESGGDNPTARTSGISRGKQHSYSAVPPYPRLLSLCHYLC